MRKSILALTLASTAALGACATNSHVAQDAAIGAAGGAAVGAVVPGVGVIEGAAVGAAIGGLAGAIWSDTNNDGYVDGYTYNGQYYAGTPTGYDPGTHSVCARHGRPRRSSDRRGRRRGPAGCRHSPGRGDRRGRRRACRRNLGRPE